MAVLFDVINDVEGTLRLDVSRLRTLPEGYAVHHRAALGIDKLQLDVLLVASHNLACAEVIDLLRAEKRLLIVGAVWRKALDVGHNATGNVAKIDDGINAQDGTGLFRLNVFLDVLLEAMAKLGNVLCRHTQAGSVCVAAKVLKQVGTTLDGLIDIEARDAACRAGRHTVVVASEHDAGLIEDFRQAGSHDADDATMPFLVVEDDGLVLVLVFQSLDDAIGLLGHRLVQVLTLLVVFVDLLCQPLGFRGVFLYEKGDGFVAGLHTAGSIDARPYLEDDVAQRYLLVLQSANLHQRFDTDAGRAVQLAKSVVGKDAVLAHNGHDVRSNADGTEVEKRDKLGELNTVVDGKSLYQLEAHAAAAEVLVGIRVVRTLGVQNSHSGRQLLVRHMVVADNEVDAFFLGVGNFVDCLDAAVEHNNEPDTRLASIVHSLARNAVTILVAVGDVVVDVAIELL